MKNYLILGLCDLALLCGDYSSHWLIGSLITHDMALLSPQSTMSLYISLKKAKLCLCQIFGKEKINSCQLDKKVVTLNLDQG